MKVAITGTRTLHTDISNYVPNRTTLIITGNRRGIEAMARQYAKENDIKIKVIYPEYDKYGKKASVKCDERIVDIADMIINIWDFKSNETKYIIEYALETGKPIRVYVV